MDWVNLLFIKRLAFEHESEFRVVAVDNGSNDVNSISNGLKIKPKSVIDSILIDPRAPDELADALIYYFRE